VDDTWKTQRVALGTFLRGQRKLANLSLRELARLTDLSNAYLSQVERGIHEPSVRVLRSIAQALDLAPTSILARAGLTDEERPPPAGTEDAILSDPHLGDAQKAALIAVYRSYLRERAADSSA
jgi:transcriptional regulator with XRE-family HTH domain